MKKIQLDKLTGEELKHLLEQKTESGEQIATIPDIFAFFDGIKSGETIEEYLQRIIGTLDIIPESSVGSRELKDGSVGKVDVDDEVKEGLDELNNVGIEDKDIEDIFFPDGDVPDGIYDGINEEEDADTEQDG